MGEYSTIGIRERKESKTVKIGASLNSEIIEELVNKWQSLIDTAAQIANVPSGLIMRLNTNTIEVFLKSNTEGNPYEIGEEAELIHGLYCETVIGKQEKLLVPDAKKSDVWRENNPDVDINMISYLGHPINWPNGDVFGTVCILDNKENFYNELINSFIFQIKQHIETDLELVYVNEVLKEKNKELELLNTTKTRFLSLISHDLRGKIGASDQLLKFASKRFIDLDRSKVKDIINTASKSIDSSFNLLENLLIWAKSDFVQLEPDKKEINISSCFDILIQEFSLELEQKKIEIIKNYYSDDAIMMADENMLIIILRNLLSNAIKYSSEYGIISVGFEPCIEGFLLKIEDSGIGMSKATVQHLFNYNSKHHPKGTKGESSAGIGLMLIKEFIDQHGAKINVDSEIGLGTKVQITWPG